MSPGSVSPKSVVIVGGGEHARVVADAALSRPDLWKLEGFIDIDPSRRLPNLPDLPRLGWADELIAYSRDQGWWSVIGVGATRSTGRRREIVDLFSGSPVQWATVVHATAWISPGARVREGVVVCAGAIVNAGAGLGAHAVLNTGSIVEHDVSVGDYAMLSPGAVVGGGTVLEDGCFIGLGASVRDHVRVGRNATVGMGAVVVRDVPAGQTVMGVPARQLS